MWDPLLIKYRYFFPVTIERNLQYLVKQKFLQITYDNSLLTFMSGLFYSGSLKNILTTMVSLGEDTNEIFSYTQNVSQLADYMTYTQSQLKTYTLPTGTDDTSVVVQTYYSTVASVFGRSLLVAFLEQCLISGYITLANIPSEYITPNMTIYPYINTSGGYYGCNTPLRVLNYNIRTE